MSDRVTRVELARLAGISEAGVRYHIAAGHILPGADNLLDRRDAETLRQMRNVVSTSLLERNHALLRSRARAAAVKISRIEHQTRKLQADTFDRAPVAAALQDHARQVLARLATIPPRYVDEVAGAMGCDTVTAYKVLERFTGLALKDLGDIHAEAEAALQRLAGKNR